MMDFFLPRNQFNFLLKNPSSSIMHIQQLYRISSSSSSSLIEEEEEEKEASFLPDFFASPVSVDYSLLPLSSFISSPSSSSFLNQIQHQQQQQKQERGKGKEKEEERKIAKNEIEKMEIGIECRYFQSNRFYSGRVVSSSFDLSPCYEAIRQLQFSSSSSISSSSFPSFPSYLNLSPSPSSIPSSILYTPDIVNSLINRHFHSHGQYLYDILYTDGDIELGVDRLKLKQSPQQIALIHRLLGRLLKKKRKGIGKIPIC